MMNLPTNQSPFPADGERQGHKEARCLGGLVYGDATLKRADSPTISTIKP
jgi:hypothetical protein